MDSKQVVEAAEIALDNHLYVYKTWDMYKQLTDTIKTYKELEYFNGCSISLAYWRGYPIGIAHMDITDSLMIYVKKEFRRMGIGSKLINSMVRNSKYKVTAGIGMKGSMEFWEKNKINLESDYDSEQEN